VLVGISCFKVNDEPPLQEQILKEKSERMGKVLTARNQVFKRIRAEHENMQLSAIQASTVRIQYFKSRKLDA